MPAELYTVTLLVSLGTVTTHGVAYCIDGGEMVCVAQVSKAVSPVIAKEDGGRTARGKLIWDGGNICTTTSQCLPVS